MNRAKTIFLNVAATGIEMLREIFDEAAYARFLNRAGTVSSSESYAAFRREFEAAKTRRPKCC